MARAFRERLNEHGLSLTELAQLAALLERFASISSRLLCVCHPFEDSVGLSWGPGSYFTHGNKRKPFERLLLSVV